MIGLDWPGLMEGVAERLLTAPTPWRPLPHQTAPDWDDPHWRYWVLMAGRGAGKTDWAAHWFDQYMRSHPGTRGRVIAPTIGDAWEACVIGPSGLLAHNPQLKPNVTKGIITWPNGSRARTFGAYTPEDVERLRAGGNSGLDWYEELAAWVRLDAAWDQARFGLRLGGPSARPRSLISTTPKPRALIRRLISDARAVVVSATTDDNPHLPETVREDLHEMYDGTRLGQQELMAVLLTDVPGALWHLEQIAADRVYAPPCEHTLIDNVMTEVVSLARVVVGVDPPGSSHAPSATGQRRSDEAGIVVAGRGHDGHGYVLADRSLAVASPEQWGRAAVTAWADYEADEIAVEGNFGGEMAGAVVINAAKAMGIAPLPRIRMVHASRGKAIRAEPIAQLYEQHKVHHVGIMDALEAQLTEWSPDAGHDSPDRMDACVWALTACMGSRRMMRAPGDGLSDVA